MDNRPIAPIRALVEWNITILLYSRARETAPPEPRCESGPRAPPISFLLDRRRRWPRRATSDDLGGSHGQQADRANLCSGLLLMRALLKSLLVWLEYNHPAALAGARGWASRAALRIPTAGADFFLT